MTTVLKVYLVWLWTLVVVDYGSSSKVWLDDHGRYQNIVIAVHPALSSQNCTELFTNLQNVVSRFSNGLTESVSDGQLSVGRVQVVMPHTMAQACYMNHLPHATWHKWSKADIRVTPGASAWERWSPEGSLSVGVKQVRGCTRPAQYITLQAPELMSGGPESNVQQEADRFELIGRSLLAAWARYRWGVFEERGYESDSLYPQQQEEVCLPHRNCTERPVKSMMQKISLEMEPKFCDATTHDYESRTPQNLACSGHSVSEVLHHHSDFEMLKDKLPIVAPSTSTTISGPFSTVKTLEQRNDLQLLGGSEVSNQFSSEVKNNEDLTMKITNKNGQSDGQSPSTDVADEKEIISEVETFSRIRRSFMDDSPIIEENFNESFVNGTDNNENPTNSSGEVNYFVESQQDIQEMSENNTQSDSLDNTTKSSRTTTTTTTTTTATTTSIPTSTPSLPTTKPASLWPDTKGFNKVWFDLLVAPPPVVVVALDLSQAAIDEVGVEAQRGALLRWMWSLPSTSRLAVLAAYNNDSFHLTLSPLPPAPRSATQLKARLALLPLQEEAARGEYGGEHCLSCVMRQALQLVQQGGATPESAVLIIAACRVNVGATERHIIETFGMTVHTVALCSTTSPQLDELADPHGAWVLPSNAGPQDGERQLTRTLSSIMRQEEVMPADTNLEEVHENGRYIVKDELQSSGAYSLVSGTLSLKHRPSDVRRLVLFSTTSSAKVVEVRDSDDRRLDVIRDTGRRFWIETAASGQLTYTFKFLTTSLAFPLYISEDVYELKPSAPVRAESYSRQGSTDTSGIIVMLYTSNEGHLSLVPESPAVVVWAEITGGDGWPVLDALVTLTVTHLPSGISSNYTLLDNGNTEPDARANDGVYSRYLSWRLGEGRYSLTATAMLQPRPGGESSSKTHISSARTLYVSRVSFTDNAPPSRITDLSATLIDTTEEPLVNLTWSAPGGELDQGSASLYEIKMYTERQVLTQEHFNGSGIIVHCMVEGIASAPPPPAIYGSPQHCLTNVPFTDIKWYFAIRGVDTSNNTGRVSNIAWLVVPKPAPPSTLPSTLLTQSLSPTTLEDSSNSSLSYSTSAVDISVGWRPYVVAGACVLGLLMIVGAAVACVCCWRRARQAKEKDPDRPVYKIYVNNAYIQEDDGEIKVVQEWVNSLDKYGNVEAGEISPGADANELKNKSSFKYTSPVRFGVLTNGSIMRDATTGSTNSSSSSSRPSDETQQDEYKYRDLSETTSDSTTEGIPPSSSSSAATEVISLVQTDHQQTSAALALPPYQSPHRISYKDTNISSLPLPSPRKNPPSTPPVQRGALALHAPLSPHDYTSEEEGGFRPRNVGGSPPTRRQLPNHFSSFRYLPPPPQYRTQEFSPYLPPVSNSSTQQQQHLHLAQQHPPAPSGPPLSRVNGSLSSHGTVRSVKKRRHISFV